MRIEGNIHGRSRRKLEAPEGAYAAARARYGSGDFAAAIAIIETAVAGGEASAPMYVLYGAALSNLGRLDEADRQFEAALAVDPSSAMAYRNLAANANRREDRKAAVAHFEKLAAIEPGDDSVRRQLADAYVQHEDYAKAAALYRDFIARDPGDDFARFQLLTIGAYQCDWSDYEVSLAALAAWTAADEPEHLPNAFYMIAWPGVDERTIFKALTLRAKRTTLDDPPLYPANPVPAAERKRRGDKLKIGYLSNDFHEHATMFLLGDVLAGHDKSRFETVAFAHDRDDKSPTRRQVEAAFDDFVDVRAMENAALARTIHDRGIDILIDLKGHTRGSRPFVLMRRPAPIVASFLGYPGTTGMACVDYLIADPIVVPKASARYYSERIACLPVTYQPNAADRAAAGGQTRARWGLPEDALVYGNLNQTYKITPEMFAAWMTILRRVEGSVLWLWAWRAEPQRNLRRAAAEHDVDPARLIFAKTAKPDVHLGRVGLIDVALDTAPCSSHTTGSDALRCGVPLVGFKSDSFAGRVSASLLNAFGLPELVTETVDDYVDLAVRLGTDGAYLRAMRVRMAEARTSAYLFDPRRFTRDLEALYEKMWSAYAAGTMTKYLS